MMQVDITIFVNVLILHPFLPKWMNGGYWDVCNDCHKPIEDTYGYNSEDYLEEIMSRND